MDESYLVGSMVRLFTYERIKCKKHKCLFRYIGQLTIETVHEIAEISKEQN